MKKSIRYYYFTSIATVLVTSLLIMGLIQIYLATTYFRGEKERQLEQTLQIIDKSSRSGELIYNETSIPALYLLARVTNSVILFSDLNGNIFYSTDGSLVPSGRQLSGQIQNELYSNGIYKETGKMGGIYPENHYTLGMPLVDGDNTLHGYVFASTSAGGLQVYIVDIMSTFVLSAGLVLLVSSLLALVLANRTIIPIRRIGATARRFGEGDYTARAPVDGDDELAQLAITFNEMASSFEASEISHRSFMGNIAHELRTPMTTIKGFIDGILDGTIPPEQQNKYLAIVSEEVGRLSRLTRNMLDISRLEAGEYTTKTVTFDIWEPLAAVLVSTRQRMEEKNIKVETIDAETNTLVLADKDFVHQVVFNLIDNAIKFTGEEGTITVSAKTEKNMVTIRVRNSGEGIPGDKLGTIFDRFYKMDQSRNVSTGGAGLGLHISKVLVNMMGGRIWADSKEGEWSEFCFTLPAAPAQKKKPEKKPPAKKNEAGKNPAQGEEEAAPKQ